jgi:RNA polymerase sigma-70 factor, ECF subfamily
VSIEALAETVRIEGRNVLATLVRMVGLSIAEDAVQEAAVAALRTWPQTGVPDNPRAWLTVTARHKAFDTLRREAARAVKEKAASWGVPELTADPVAEVIDMIEPESALGNDLLRLVFTCCHPALAREAQVALALRTLVGLDVGAIARVFLVEEATMAKRLVRARRKIADARIPYRVPEDSELPDRLGGVLAVVYLIATEAHAPSQGDEPVRIDLETEAIRLARLLVDLMPDEPEVQALLALLLLTMARRPSRVDALGRPVLLRDQDRRLWDRPAIAEGSARLDEAVRRTGGVAGPYQLRAHLAACHSTAQSWAETDWPRIVALYDLLLALGANPFVELNRAVAVTELAGAAAGLATLDAIDGLAGSHLWRAARADALGRLGRLDEARAELRIALDAAPTGPERQLLADRLAGVG